MTVELGLAITMGVVGLLGAVGAVFWWLNRTPSGYRRDPDAGLPLYSVTLAESRRRTPSSNTPVSQSVVAPAALRPAAPWPAAQPTPAPSVATAPPVAAPSRPVTAPPPPLSRVATVPLPAAPLTAPLSPVTVSENGVPGSMVEGHRLRFSVPQEGTLQFLPGRLEIANGLDEGREVRFVRVPGPNGTEVTFGRSEGPLYRHIQLREATVSRLHARLVLHESTWHLINLSATNPAVYNSGMLELGSEQTLSDGDRIEMGEVVFVFRSR